MLNPTNSYFTNRNLDGSKAKRNSRYFEILFEIYRNPGLRKVDIVRSILDRNGLLGKRNEQGYDSLFFSALYNYGYVKSVRDGTSKKLYLTGKGKQLMMDMFARA